MVLLSFIDNCSANTIWGVHGCLQHFVCDKCMCSKTVLEGSRDHLHGGCLSEYLGVLALASVKIVITVVLF